MCKRNVKKINLTTKNTKSYAKCTNVNYYRYDLCDLGVKGFAIFVVKKIIFPKPHLFFIIDPLSF